MPYNSGNPTGSQSLEITISNLEHISDKMLEVKFPELLWRNTVPASAVDTSVHPGANTASYTVEDHRGMGQFVGRRGQISPTVGLAHDKVSVPMRRSAVAAEFTTKDRDRFNLMQQTMGNGGDLFSKLGRAMTKASERHQEVTFFYGFDEVGYEGYLDYSLVPTTTAVDPGAGTEWVNKTPSQVIADINDAITSVMDATKNIHVPNRVELPTSQFNFIASQPRSTNSDTTILQFLLKNNAAQAHGGTLDIRPLRYLDGAGAGATDRMRISTVKEDVMWLPQSMALSMLNPQEVNLTVNLIGEYEFGPIHIIEPLSQLNVDGI